ncbi:MAG: hypothetical protein LBC73_05635 [Oscillospiraceae bacterium]|nr:hypothetical protein [Oscillospiraceae bacterium]
MQEIIIDRDFQYLLPQLDEQSYAGLEANILKNGIRDSLVLWQGILIDGYNRYSIATKHNLPFNTITMEFNSREEVTIWIITNQIERRNLTPFQLRYFRGLHYQAERRNQSENNQYLQGVGTNRQNDGLLNTARFIADKYNVSPRTIERDSRLTDALIVIGEVSPEAKESILSGETKITRKELDAMLTDSKETIIEIADSIENGTFADRKIDSINNNKTLDSAFSRIFEIIQRELNGLAKAYTPSQMKKALKSHIKALEEIYNQI